MKKYPSLLLLLSIILLFFACRKSSDDKKLHQIADPNHARVYTADEAGISDKAYRMLADSMPLQVSVSGGARPLYITIAHDQFNTDVITDYWMTDQTSHKFMLPVGEQVMVFVRTNTGEFYSSGIFVVVGTACCVSFSLP